MLGCWVHRALHRRWSLCRTLITEIIQTRLSLLALTFSTSFGLIYTMNSNVDDIVWFYRISFVILDEKHRSGIIRSKETSQTHPNWSKVIEITSTWSNVIEKISNRFKNHKNPSTLLDIAHKPPSSIVCHTSHSSTALKSPSPQIPAYKFQYSIKSNIHLTLA